MKLVLVAVAALAFMAGPLATDGRADTLAGAGYSSSYAGESVFEGKAAGESGQFSVIFFNDGTRSWAPTVVGLLICLPDKTTCNVPSPNAEYASGWFSGTAYATVSATVAPGQNGFFVYDFTVPAGTPAGTVVTFNGDVGLIANGARLRPEGYYHQNTTPSVLGTLSISPPSALLATLGQQQFTAATNLVGTIGWSVTGGCGAITPTGLFVATATNAATQPCTVVASIGSLRASAIISVYGPATLLSCTAVPAAVVATGGGANGTATVTIAVTDANGNTVAAGAPAITVANATPSIATVTPTGTLAMTSGTATLTVTTTMTPGTIVITGYASTGITGCSLVITSAAAGVAARADASFVDSPIAADGVSTTTLRIDIEDANGSRTTSSATVVDVARAWYSAGICSVLGVTTGTSGSASGAAGTATAALGRVEFVVISTTAPGTCAITATPRTTTVGASTATLVTRTVGAAARVAVYANDSPHAAGSASLTTVTVEIQDASGNRITSSTLPVSVTLDPSTCTGASPGSVAISSWGSTSAGRAVFQLTSYGAYTACVATFTAAGLSATTASLVFTSASADHVGCAFTPSWLLNNGSMVSVAVVALQDQAGNNVALGSYSVSFSLTTGTGATSVLTSSPQTMINGTATFLVRATNAVGTDTYTPSVSGIVLPNVAANSSCSISVGPTAP